MQRGGRRNCGATLTGRYSGPWTLPLFRIGSLTLADRLADTETTREGSTVSALIDLTKTTEQPGASGYGYYDLLRAAARGEFIGLPAALRGWLDLSGKIIATLLVPVSALYDASRQAAPTVPAPGRPEGPATTGRDDASI